MERGEADEPASTGDPWSATRVERLDWQLGDRRLAGCATYRVVGGQRDAFDALRAFSHEHLEPVVVDLHGITTEMRDSFLRFLGSTGLSVVGWVDDDVVVLTATTGRGGAGVREPRTPLPPPRHLDVEAPLGR